MQNLKLAAADLSLEALKAALSPQAGLNLEALAHQRAPVLQNPLQEVLVLAAPVLEITAVEAAQKEAFCLYLFLSPGDQADTMVPASMV